MEQTMMSSIRWLFFPFLFLYSSVTHAAYVQEIYYVGMSCNKIQADSVVSPSNEVFINTIVHNPLTGKVSTLKHPYNRSLYKKVKKGYVANGPSKLIWRGRQQPLELRVLMWEHDNGSTAVNVFSEYLSAIVTGKITGGKSSSAKSSRGRVPTNNAPEGQPIIGVDKDPLTKLFSKGYGNLLGTNHDLMGYTRVVLQKGNWSKRKLRRHGRIRYNYKVRHNRGGANCYSYFLFKRGAYYKVKNKKSNHSAPKKQNSNRNRVPARQPNFNTRKVQCRAKFDNCNKRIQRCKNEVKNNKYQVQKCEKHGWKQHQQCIAYYLSSQRNKKYSRTQAQRICRQKYDSYLRQCPRLKRDNCGSYSVCDNRYRSCMR